MIHVNFDLLDVYLSDTGDGNMSDKYDALETVKERRMGFISSIKGNPQLSTWMAIKHSGEVQVKPQQILVECDALIEERMNGKILVLPVADCVPLVLVGGAYVALVHASRVTLEKGILFKVVEEMAKLGEMASSMKVWIGPHVQPWSYKFEKSALTDYWLEAEIKDKELVELDLGKKCVKSLEEFGVFLGNITYERIDTYSDERFFSHRRSVAKGEPEGRFVVAVKC